MRNFLTLLAVIIAVNINCQTFAQKNDFNFGFEKTTPGEILPDNLIRWGAKEYDIAVDTLVKHQGKNSICIQSIAGRAPGSFGSVAYAIPAVYKGNEIEVRAFMKFQDVKDGPIGLLLRIDDETESLEFDNMRNKNIQGTSDWVMYSVKLPLPEKAKTIYLGALLSGTGKLWVDDFELLIDGETLATAKLKKVVECNALKDKEFDKGSNIDTITLTDDKITDLQVLGLVWGFLKYYHPAIAAGEYNWDYELFRILPSIIDARNAEKRDSILTAWIVSLGRIESTNPSVEEYKNIKLTPDTSWIHQANLSAALVLQLQKVKHAKRNGQHFYLSLTDGVKNPTFDNEKAYAEMPYPDLGFRLLSLYRYWNIIQYFFPYKNLIEEDWKKVLQEFIPKYCNAKSQLEYKLAVLELIGRVHDTHANIWGWSITLNNYRGINYAPVEITFVENKAVVTDYLDQGLAEKSGLQIGDVITKIDNKPVDTIIVERLKYTPASNYPTQLRDIAQNLLRTNDSLMKIEFVRNGVSFQQVIDVYSTKTLNVYKKWQTTDTCFKLINPDIAYIFPGTIKNKYIPEIMKNCKKTKGLIIDLRCYPAEFIVFTLGEYLLPEKTLFARFTEGNIKTPGVFTMTMQEEVGRKNKSYYKGKIVVLVNEKTQSQAEYTTMAFSKSPNATVIGSTTAGADGNVSQLYLPGGIFTMFSGIGVYYPDRKETQRVGIAVDIEVKPTIEGVKLRKDEVLEKAIEIINMK